MSAMASQITSVTIIYSTVFRRRSKKTSKLRVTGLCEGNSLVTGEFPAQRASNAANVSIWWRHHDSELPAYDGSWCRQSLSGTDNDFVEWECSSLFRANFSNQRHFNIWKLICKVYVYIRVFWSKNQNESSQLATYCQPQYTGPCFM